MITTAFLNLVFAFVWLLTKPLSLLPNVSMPVGITSAFTNIQAYLAALNPVFPVADLAIALGILVTVEMAFKLLESFGFVIRKIPGGMS